MPLRSPQGAVSRRAARSRPARSALRSVAQLLMVQEARSRASRALPSAEESARFAGPGTRGSTLPGASRASESCSSHVSWIPEVWMAAACRPACSSRGSPRRTRARGSDPESHVLQWTNTSDALPATPRSRSSRPGPSQSGLSPCAKAIQGKSSRCPSSQAATNRTGIAHGLAPLAFGHVLCRYPF